MSPTAQRVENCAGTSGGTRGSFLNLPVNLAGPLGYFDAETVGVRVEETASVSRSAQSLVGGSADIAVGGILRPLMLAREGRRVKAFVVMLSQPGFVAAVSPVFLGQFAGSMTSKEPTLVPQLRARITTLCSITFSRHTGLTRPRFR